MKITTIMILFSTLFLIGCAPKSGFFSEDKLHQSALSQTQKGEIYNSLEMKASIVATYLNRTEIACDRAIKEVFLVAVYIDRDSSDESKQGLLNPSYTLTLDGEKPVGIRALDYHDDLILIAPFRNRWSRYYVVEFDRIDKSGFVLKYAHKNLGNVTLEFAKD